MKNPFLSPPMSVFNRRVIFILFVVGVILFYCVGVFSRAPFFTSLPGDYRPPFEVAVSFYIDLFNNMTSSPEICRQSTEMTSFHKEQCKNYEKFLLRRIGLGIFPLLFIVLLYLVLYDRVVSFYRSIHRLTKEMRALERGEVERQHLFSDFFSWFFCLRSIRVRLKNEKSRVVYQPVGAPEPLNGQKLAVFEVPRLWRKKRYFALLDAPNLDTRSAHSD